MINIKILNSDSPCGQLSGSPSWGVSESGSRRVLRKVFRQRLSNSPSQRVVDSPTRQVQRALITPECRPGQLAYTFLICILSTSLTSVSIFSVCCYSSVSISVGSTVRVSVVCRHSPPFFYSQYWQNLIYLPANLLCIVLLLGVIDWQCKLSFHIDRTSTMQRLYIQNKYN